MRAFCLSLVGRVLLTVALLAMMTGAFALIVLTSLNAAGQVEIRQRGGDGRQTYLLYLRPEYLVRGTPDQGLLDDVDVAALAEAVPEVDAIALWETQNLMRVELGEKRYPPPDAAAMMMPMLGRVEPALEEVMGLRLAAGRFIKAADLQYKRAVGVIGAGLHRRLGGGQVIGEELTIKMIEWDGTQVSQTFTVVGVLQAELPLLTGLPLSDGARWNLLPRLIDRPRPGRAPDGRAFQALQREQLAISRLAINETVFIPWTSDNGLTELTPDTLVYLSVSVPNAPGSRRLIVDQETMESGPAPSDPCEECEAACPICALPPYLMPQGLLEVADEMRAVLRSRLGNDRLFQFMHMETVSDAIRFELRWLNRLLGAIIVAGLFLCPISLMAGVVVLRRTVNGSEAMSAEGPPKESGPRPNTFSGYTRICLFSVSASVIAGGVLSYWLVTRVLLWH